MTRLALLLCGCTLLPACALAPRPSLPSYLRLAESRPDSLPAPTAPQDSKPRLEVRPSQERRTRIVTGMGFTADPSTFLLGFQLDRMTRRGLLIGPQVQLGTSDDETFFAVAFNIKKEYEIRNSKQAPVLFPFVQAGIGLAFLEKDQAPGDNDEVDLLINTGTGFRLPLDDGISLSSTLMLNLIPGEIVGERFIFSWQVAQLQFLF